MGGPYEKTTPFPFPSERFPQGIAPSYLADLTYETAVAAKVLADAILEAKSDDTAEILAARAILAAEQRADERAARMIDARLQEIAQEYGRWEPDTNYTNLPEWAETVFDVMEPIAVGIRNRTGE